jgi:hypothetical protein
MMSAPSWFCAVIYAKGFWWGNFIEIFSSIFIPKGKLPNFGQRISSNHNFGNQSLNGMYYCSKLKFGEPIHNPSRVYYTNILNKFALKGIRKAPL